MNVCDCERHHSAFGWINANQDDWYLERVVTHMMRCIIIVLGGKQKVNLAG